MEPTTNTAKVIIAIIAFALGGVVTFTGMHFYERSASKNTLSTGRPMPDEVRARMALANVPACIPQKLKSSEDKDVISYTIQYNTMMTPRLEALQTKLTKPEYKALVASEITRQKEETALMKTLYKSATGVDYSDKVAQSPLVVDIAFSTDTNKDTTLSEADRMSLFRGELEHIDTQFYTFVANASKNAQLMENAKKFKAFKADLVGKLLKVK